MEFRCGIGRCRKMSRTQGGISNHRTWAHKMESDNPEAIARAGRRDRADPNRVRVALRTRPALPIPKPPVGVRPYLPKPPRLGPLDVGDREILRRRLLYDIFTAYARAVDRHPNEVCAAIAELCSNRLRPKGTQRIFVPGIDGYAPSRR